MIVLRDLSKSFWVKGREKVVADGLDAVFPSGRSVALLGRNGAGKSTLLDMIAGKLRPDSGAVEVHGSVSWPVGFAGNFQRQMTGAQNVRFVARAYGVDSDELEAFVADFAEIGPHFDAQLRYYSAGMRSRLAFGLSMGIPFDTYLVDEVTSVGDANFKKKCFAVFGERMKTAGAIVVSHEMRQLRRLCDSAMLLSEGRLTWFDDVDEAIDAHESINA